MTDFNCCIIDLFCGDSNNILVVYPYEMRNEKILQDNICKMQSVIREYINETEQYNRCISVISRLFFDSQKETMQSEADKHQQKADELAEIMNDGISPYAWYIKKNFDCWIDNVQYKARYVVYLDKI